MYSIQAKSGSEDIPLTPVTPGDSVWPPIASQADQPVPFTLRQPPKWMRRPIAGSFGFGNRLVTFSSVKESTSRKINILQVVADPEVAKRAQRLQTAVDSGDFVTFCEERLETVMEESERTLWSFLKYAMDENARERIVALLGFDREKLAEKVAALKLGPVPKPVVEGVKVPEPPAPVATDDTAANGDAAVSDLFGGQTAEFNVSSAPSVASTDAPVAAKFSLYANNVTTDVDASITRAILVADYEGAVDICLRSNRMEDALILSMCGGPELMESTRAAFFDLQLGKIPYVRVLAGITKQNLADIVNHVDVVNTWREVLAMICTYAKSEEFSALANALAARLEQELSSTRDPKTLAGLKHAVTLSYVAAGNVERVVAIWSTEQNTQLQSFLQKLDKKHVSLHGTREFGLLMQSFVEKIAVLRKATGHSLEITDETADEKSKSALEAQRKVLLQKYSTYSSLVLNQGEFATALKYINLAKGVEVPVAASLANADDKVDLVTVVKQRIHGSLKTSVASQFGQVGALPFAVADVKRVVDQTANWLDPSPKKAAVSKQQTAPVTQPVVQQAAYPSANPQYPGYPPQQPAAYPYYPQQPAAPTYQAPVTQQPSYGTLQQQQQQPYNPYPGYGYPQQQAQQPAPPAAPPVTKSFVAAPPPITTGPAVTQAIPPQSPQPLAAATVPARNIGGFNDPPADVFQSKKKVHGSSAPIMAPFPNQGYPTSPTTPAGPPTGPPVMGRQPSYGQPGMPPQAGYAPPAMQQPGQPPMQQPAYGYPPQQPSTPVAPAAPEKQRYREFHVKGFVICDPSHSFSYSTYAAMGDRSHIVPEEKPIFETFSRCLNGCKPNAAVGLSCYGYDFVSLFVH